MPGSIAFTLTPSRLPRPDKPFVKLCIAALTEPPIRNSGSGVRAAPPMTLTTCPCAVFEQRPEQAAEPHAAEELERETVLPRLLGEA